MSSPVTCRKKLLRWDSLAFPPPQEPPKRTREPPKKLPKSVLEFFERAPPPPSSQRPRRELPLAGPKFGQTFIPQVPPPAPPPQTPPPAAQYSSRPRPPIPLPRTLPPAAEYPPIPPPPKPPSPTPPRPLPRQLFPPLRKTFVPPPPPTPPPAPPPPPQPVFPRLKKTFVAQKPPPAPPPPQPVFPRLRKTFVEQQPPPPPPAPTPPLHPVFPKLRMTLIPPEPPPTTPEEPHLKPLRKPPRTFIKKFDRQQLSTVAPVDNLVTSEEPQAQPHKKIAPKKPPRTFAGRLRREQEAALAKEVAAASAQRSPSTTPEVSVKSTALPTIEEVDLDSYFSSDYVYSLNPNNFTKFLKTKDVALVMFYNPRSPESMWSSNHFAEAAAITKRENHAFAAVDCKTEKNFCIKQNVLKTPMFTIYSKGTALGSIRIFDNFTTDVMKKYVEAVPVIDEYKRPAKSCEGN